MSVRLLYHIIFFFSQTVFRSPDFRVWMWTIFWFETHNIQTKGYFVQKLCLINIRMHFPHLVYKWEIRLIIEQFFFWNCRSNGISTMSMWQLVTHIYTHSHTHPVHEYLIIITYQKNDRKRAAAEYTSNSHSEWAYTNSRNGKWDEACTRASDEPYLHFKRGSREMNGNRRT